MNKNSMILTILSLASNLAFAASPCDQVQAEIDQYQNIDQIVDYLKVGVEKQKDLTVLFQCLAGPQRLPTDLISGDRNFIFGDGWGSGFANNKIPLWNQFQSQLGRSVWGGKILRKTVDGAQLLNVMRDRKTMSYAAEVYNIPSIVDGQDSVVLDYRSDATVGLVSSLFIRRVRDELREVQYQGQATGIYLGRAYLFTGSLDDRFSNDWQEASSFVFGANFLLDFRPQHQQEIPAWALAFFE